MARSDKTPLDIAIKVSFGIALVLKIREINSVIIKMFLTGIFVLVVAVKFATHHVFLCSTDEALYGQSVRQQ